MMTIGDRIRIRREQLQLSQDDLAKKLGYKSRSSINKIELGGQNLTQSKIKAIADALDTTPSYIMGWEEQIDLYIQGAKKWVDDFRFSEKQKERIIEYLADSALKLKKVVNSMADARQEDGKILMNTSLKSALEDISHWTGNAVKYVNEDFSDDPFSEESIKEQYLSAISKLSRRDQVAWLIRIQDYICENGGSDSHTNQKEDSQ